MPQNEERVEARNVSLYPSDWNIIDEYGTPMGLNTSAALRVIVRQWQQRLAVNELGQRTQSPCLRAYPMMMEG